MEIFISSKYISHFIMLYSILNGIQSGQCELTCWTTDSRGCCLRWWRHQMEPFSPLLAICAGNSQRPVTRSFDLVFDIRLNKRLSKQSWGRWFETPSRPLWRHSNESERCELDPCMLNDTISPPFVGYMRDTLQGLILNFQKKCFRKFDSKEMIHLLTPTLTTYIVCPNFKHSSYFQKMFNCLLPKTHVIFVDILEMRFIYEWLFS